MGAMAGRVDQDHAPQVERNEMVALSDQVAWKAMKLQR
jgi:hypothetical protein